jgi:flagellar assembly protein FliH
MTSSSDRRRLPNVPPPPGVAPATAYARFIPREELQDFRAWQPGSLGAERPAAAQQAPAQPPVQSWKNRLAAERQEGYQEGYRDGLVALEGFKQGYATQMSERVGQLLENFDQQLVALETQMADVLARSAVLLARQVLRQELRSHPDAIVDVAREAVGALVASARQVVVRVHPDDLALVAEGAAEALAARGARLQRDPTVARGGCRIDSDAGGVDASLDSRWARAAAALGHPLGWDPAPADGTPGTGAADAHAPIAPPEDAA